MRKAFCSVLLLWTSVILLSGLGCLCEHDGKVSTGGIGQSKTPHLIFIMVDDQGYGDIGYHGSDVHTPALDQLAAEGVKLENYYVQPICSPSRSQLMTGRYQIHTGLQHSIIRPRQPLCLPPDVPTLPERLAEAGYATHMVGKWHLGFSRPNCLPTRRGFQSFLGTLTGSGDHFSYQSCDGAEACGFDLHDGNRPAWEMRGNYSTLLYIERRGINGIIHKRGAKHNTIVKKILQSHNSQRPLFLYLSLQAAHTPLQAPDLFLHHYDAQSNRQRRHYAAMLSCLDEGIAELVKELKTSGLYQNSVLIYSSDNGGQPLSGGSNWPLRGGKGTYWEGGIRAVGFVHSPLLKRKGIVSRALIHISDWYPTLLGLAETLQSHHNLDGHNVWASISEGNPGEPYDKALELNGFGIWDTAVRAALRVGDWKLLTGNVGDGDWIPPQALPAGPERWQKLEKRRNRPGKSVWLFNVSADPYERFDLAEVRPEVVKHLLARLAEYNHTAVMARNPPDDPLADPELHGGVWSPWLGLEGWGRNEKDKDGKKGKIAKVRLCKLCKLKALFKKVESRLERKTLF
ncbi:hypothetical protein CCH79_00019567 [Gambusia affinis]|uniref:Sulfatase N-terminal domain-containing protein n=1 Tax=Gambusia affinis TaxID=33528 RepID=A0A315VCV8_GAMAF|nr:hypothetical protein CCH79_00019567 [Gambusia affinis]